MEDRFVRVDCDWGADGLWTRRGSAIAPEYLGLSEALCLALRAWQAHYDELRPEVNPQPFDFVAHERIGRAIAELVRKERPDLHVVYGHDEPYPGERTA